MLHHEAGWTNPKVIAILAVVFFCGSAFGAAAMREYFHHRFALPAAHDFPYRGHRIRFETLKTELNLSPDQEQTVKKVLDDFAKFYQNIEEQREDVTEAGKRKIYAVLDPQQKERFAALVQDRPALKSESGPSK
jgi:Spy/CpxP family protein refolding chaperone